MALTWASPIRADSTMRCGSRIVSVEAIAPKVRAACGEPAYRDIWTYYATDFGRYVSDTEVWYYNFGPSQLLRILRFRNDRLVDIDTDGYGFSRPPGEGCEPNDIIEGISKYRLVLYCGEPATRNAENLLQAYRNRDGVPQGRLVTAVYREEWIYNFGARYLLRRVILENGRVVEVENGERGYDEP